MRKKSRGESAPGRITRLVRRTWLFASAVLGLDIAMLVIGMVLSGHSGDGVTYTVSGDSIIKDDPLAFFGVVAAAVLGVICVLLAFLLAGAFSRSKRRAGGILGAAGLLALSLAMVGGSAFMALGAPVKNQKFYNYSDETLQLIVEETEPYFGGGTAAFYITSAAQGGKAVLLAKTDITDYAESADRYSIKWNSEDLMQIGFADGIHYRTLTVKVDRSLLQ